MKTMANHTQNEEDDRKLGDRMVALETEMHHVRSELIAIHGRLDRMEQRADERQAAFEARFDAAQKEWKTQNDASREENKATLRELSAQQEAAREAERAALREWKAQQEAAREADRAALREWKAQQEAARDADKAALREWKIQQEAAQARIDAEQKAFNERFLALMVDVTTMKATMLTKDEFRAFIDERFSPLEQRADKNEARILRIFVGLFTTALLLFGGLLYNLH